MPGSRKSWGFCCCSCVLMVSVLSHPFVLVHRINVARTCLLHVEGDFEKLIHWKPNLFCNEGNLRWKIMLKKISVSTLSGRTDISLVPSKTHIITKTLHFLKVGTQIYKYMSQKTIFVHWTVILKKKKMFCASSPSSAETFLHLNILLLTFMLSSASYISKAL